MAETVPVGVDVGGTFTDLVIVDEASGAVRIARCRPRSPTPGVMLAADLPPSTAAPRRALPPMIAGHSHQGGHP